MKAITDRPRGYTLVEICVSLVVFAVLGGIVYSMLMSSTNLLAKNLSLNSSNLTVRAALDRIYSEINQANRLPALINVDGTGAATSEPAAGVIFDKYLGGPYIVGNPGSGLSATATSFKLFYSTDPLASPPVPVKNDVVFMDGATRALVSSCSTPTSSFSNPTPTPAPTPGKMVTVTLQDKLGTYTIPPQSSGTAISWNAASQQSAYLVHRKAFLVVPVSGMNDRAELRMYPDAETVTDYSNPANYIVLTREIGIQTRSNSPFESGAGTRYESKPFAIYTNGGASYLSVALRVEDQRFNKRLANQQANESNTFLRVDTMLRPRNIP